MPHDPQLRQPALLCVGGCWSSIACGCAVVHLPCVKLSCRMHCSYASCVAQRTSGDLALLATSADTRGLRISCWYAAASVRFMGSSPTWQQQQ